MVVKSPRQIEVNRGGQTPQQSIFAQLSPTKGTATRQRQFSPTKATKQQQPQQSPLIHKNEKKQVDESRVIRQDEARTQPPEKHSLECDFDNDPTQLYMMIQARDWNATYKRAEKTPEEAMTWVSRKEKDGRLRWRVLPIHSAVIFKAPETVVEALLCAFPKGAQSKDDQGMLPLHLAFRNGSTEGIVNLLLVAYPQSIDIKDRKGRIPLVLAQASSSPNRDFYLKALERGPTYYAVAAAATERASVEAEQRAIYDARVIEIRNDYKHQLQKVQKEATQTKLDLQDRIVFLEAELAKTQETSQVLVDHVSSLEAQLASRSDTERFLATRIASLDASYQDTSKSKEAIEQELTEAIDKFTNEKEELAEKVKELEASDSILKEKLAESEAKVAELVSESKSKVSKEAEMIKKLQLQILEKQASSAILESQLKNKIESEHNLAVQVSSLATRLAASATDAGHLNETNKTRIKQLEAEKGQLKTTIKELTSKLATLAKSLDAMTEEQERIIKVANAHEENMIRAAQAHALILEDAKRHEEIYSKAHKERMHIDAILARQEEEVIRQEEEHKKLLQMVELQDTHGQQTRMERDELMSSVIKQRMDIQELVISQLADIPASLSPVDEVVDAMVNNTTHVNKQNSQPPGNSPPPGNNNSRPTPETPRPVTPKRPTTIFTDPELVTEPSEEQLSCPTDPVEALRTAQSDLPALTDPVEDLRNASSIASGTSTVEHVT